MERFTVTNAQQAYKAAGLRPRLNMGHDADSCCPVHAWSVAAGRPHEDMFMAFSRDYVLGFIWGYNGLERKLYPHLAQFVDGFEDGSAVRGWVLSETQQHGR